MTVELTSNASHYKLVLNHGLAMQHHGKSSRSSYFWPFVTKVIAACIVAASLYYFGFAGGLPHSSPQTQPNANTAGDTVKDTSHIFEAAVDLSQSQLKAITIEPAGIYSFHIEREAVGSVAYREKDAGNDKQPDGTESDSSAKFIVASVAETDSPLIHVGQPVTAKVKAYPDRVFDGKVAVLGVTAYDSSDGNPAIDPNTHRIAVRCEIYDPRNELYPGMLATLVIQVQEPVVSVAIPANGVVRKGDGTMTVWVTKDRGHFEERAVKVGLQQNGYDQILEGLQPEELVATDGAVFISNVLYAPPSD